jgi:hypothetical protein
MRLSSRVGEARPADSSLCTINPIGSGPCRAGSVPWHRAPFSECRIEPAGRNQPRRFFSSIMRSMMGAKMISMAKPILPPGTTMLLGRDMKESWIMDSR